MSTIALLKAALLACIVAGLILVIHNNGRAVERGVWLAKENTKLTEMQKQLDAANKKARELAAQNLNLNDEVTNNAAKAMQAIIVTDSAMRRDPGGLRISAEVCRPPVPVPRPPESTENDNGTGQFDGVRLPKRTENDLYEYAIKANTARIKRDECREFALGLQRQREEWEAAQEEK